MSDTTEQNDAGEQVDEQVDNERAEELSPEDLRAALTEARRDAASQRSRRKALEESAKELEKRLGDMKSPEDVEALLQQIREESAAKERALLAENVAVTAGLPSSFAERLKGTTREELEADAKALAELLNPVVSKGTGGSDGRGGLDPSAKADADFDPVAEVAKHSRRRR